MEKSKSLKVKDKKLLTMVITFFPTLIIVAISSLQEQLIKAILLIMTALFQMVIIKNLLDEYYGD